MIDWKDYLDIPSHFRAKFKGICSHPDFVAAITASFASQASNTTAILTTGEREEICPSSSSCTTCALIAEGSSMAYSDHTCPQCGADTYHLTDPLKLIY